MFSEPIQEIALYKLKFNQMESEIQNLSMVIQDLKGQQHSQQLVEVSHDKLMERQPVSFNFITFI